MFPVHVLFSYLFVTVLSLIVFLDGGRSIWQNAWSSCMEKQHGKKSHPMNLETPLQSRSGILSLSLSLSLYIYIYIYIYIFVYFFL